MENFLIRRIQQELKKLFSSEETAQCGIKLEVLNDNFRDLKAEIVGPPDTPYEGGQFELHIKIPPNYPFGPPKIRFVTQIWHPNVRTATGTLCSNMLYYDQWSPAMTLKHLLLWIQAILSSVQLDDLQDAVVTSQFINSLEMFQLTARYWTKIYAGGPTQNRDFDDKIIKLTRFGLDKNESLAALSACDWDLEYTIDELFPNDDHNL